jgi:hypothetical protein
MFLTLGSQDLSNDMPTSIYREVISKINRVIVEISPVENVRYAH